MLQDILASMNGSNFKKARRYRGKTQKHPRPAAEIGTVETGDYRIDALNRLLASKHFRASDRNKRFLKFVVDETVAGRSERIKAFTVAVDVFGRDSSFDASVDPIVRIAAGHLRRSLHDYYAAEGANDPVRISLPLGTYVPTFVLRESLPQRTMAQLRLLVADRKRRLQSGAVGVVMALAAGGAALAYVSFGVPGHPGSQSPVIVVDSARAHAQGGTADALAQLFTQSLWIALNQDEAIRMVGVRPEEEFSEVLAHTQKNFGSSVPLYQLLTAVRLEGEALRIYWHVLDGRSNETYLSTSVAEMLTAEGEGATPDALARQVAASLNRLTADRESGSGKSAKQARPGSAEEGGG
ncbi:hypothetical protein [Chelativorans salis]|uniref:Transmembrane protein n=1 Tax=Chelativorans salis TaxID=2978478 RepID=A0ABT2LIV8_9HYPH|nr:hypothetical protein [Chelativorans sp. EGI FJ00035]MCT7373949.1 hypothetical protein [Chelativorans sp. EGI FJ00035]